MKALIYDRETGTWRSPSEAARHAFAMALRHTVSAFGLAANGEFRGAAAHTKAALAFGAAASVAKAAQATESDDGELAWYFDGKLIAVTQERPEGN